MIFFNSRGNLPSFGLTSALGINNYARIKLSFLRSFLFFFSNEMKEWSDTVGVEWIRATRLNAVSNKTGDFNEICVM